MTAERVLDWYRDWAAGPGVDTTGVTWERLATEFDLWREPLRTVEGFQLRQQDGFYSARLKTPDGFAVGADPEPAMACVKAVGFSLPAG